MMVELDGCLYRDVVSMHTGHGLVTFTTSDGRVITAVWHRKIEQKIPTGSFTAFHTQLYKGEWP